MKENIYAKQPNITSNIAHKQLARGKEGVSILRRLFDIIFFLNKSKISGTSRTSFSWLLVMINRAILYIRQRKVFKKLWKFSEGKIYVVVSILEATTERGYGNAMGEGEAATLHKILHILRSLYRPNFVEVYYSNRVPLDYKNCNLVLLGGPETNLVTKRVMEQLKPSINFDGHKIRDSSSQTYSTHEPSNPRDPLLYDHGLVIKARNPFPECEGEKFVIILAGCRTFGTLAAALFTTLYESAKIIVQQVKESCFESIVRVRLDVNPRPLYIEALAPDIFKNFSIGNLSATRPYSKTTLEDYWKPRQRIAAISNVFEICTISIFSLITLITVTAIFLTDKVDTLFLVFLAVLSGGLALTAASSLYLIESHKKENKRVEEIFESNPLPSE